MEKLKNETTLIDLCGVVFIRVCKTQNLKMPPPRTHLTPLGFYVILEQESIKNFSR